MLLVEGKELRAVATDGHRLAYASVEIETELPRQEMILPRKTVLELNRLLVDTDDQLNILTTQDHVHPFQTSDESGNAHLFTRLLAAKAEAKGELRRQYREKEALSERVVVIFQQ